MGIVYLQKIRDPKVAGEALIMSWQNLFGLSFLIVLGYMTVIWLISLAKRDSSIVDIFWGLGFVVLAVVYYFLTSGYPGRKALVTALVVLWGLRLSIRIFRRNWSREEDFRYRAWREAAGETYWWYSYFQVFLLQDDPGRFHRVNRPRQIKQFGQPGMRPAFGKATGQGGSGIEAIALVIERAGTAAGVNVGFDDSDPVAGFKQEGGGG